MLLELVLVEELISRSSTEKMMRIIMLKVYLFIYIQFL